MRKTEPTEAAAAETSQTYYSPIVELRQYTLLPGRRDTLIGLFEQAFIEAQEAVGATVIGQFRDLEKPDRFVWLRGFADMDQRLTALQTFYSGSVWREHSTEVNDLLADFDNVLKLRPVHPGSGFLLDTTTRPAHEGQEQPSGLIIATILYFETLPEASFLNFFEDTIAPTLTRHGASILSSFLTEESVNDYPSLPVREHEKVFVWFSHFRDLATYEEHVSTLAQSQGWNEQIWGPVLHRLKREPEILKLAPARRSVVR